MPELSHELPTACYDRDGARALDAACIESQGIPGYRLMQRAGRSAFAAIRERWPTAGALGVVCGPGNNGGDGFVMAREALLAGWRVTLVGLVEHDALTGDARRAADDYVAVGGAIHAFDGTAPAGDVVVDAALGVGVNREVKGDFARALDAINSAGAGVCALDLPSGLDARTGRVYGRAVNADLTVTFISVKLGLVTGDGPARCGRLVFADLGAAPADQVTPVARRVGAGDASLLLAPRSASAYKNQHGRVACAGGNRGLGGAIRLTAEAALRAGAGLVSVACHPDHAGAMSQARPELMCAGVTSDTDGAELLAGADVVAIGPGLGADDFSERLWQAALGAETALVVDADGLNRLARAPWSRGDWILTPHVGEAARLLDWSSADVAADRPAAAAAIARRYEAVVVLKGPGTLVADGRTLRVITTGNPGMAVGGTGDLLTGVIAGLVGQGLSLVEAAAIGAYVHGAAGDRAAGEVPRGLLPSDLLAEIRRGVNPSLCP